MKQLFILHTGIVASINDEGQLIIEAKVGEGKGGACTLTLPQEMVGAFCSYPIELQKMIVDAMSTQALLFLSIQLNTLTQFHFSPQDAPSTIEMALKSIGEVSDYAKEKTRQMTS